MVKPKSIVALIMAAGSGTRAGGGLPKQYQMLAGKPLLRHTMEAFLNHPSIKQTVPVINMEHQDLFRAAAGDLNLPYTIFGGSTRQESVRKALLAIQLLNADYVLIHDAARPFIDSQLIDQCINKLSATNGIFVACPLQDTLKKISAEKRLETLPRDNLYITQTPQGFPYKLILEAHEKYSERVVTDDAAIAEISGIPLKMVPGNIKNFKITTQDDFKMAEALLQNAYEYRTGQGYDVHRFTEGQFVTLGNVRINHNKGIDAHSDGDVILHALTDAILGAIGESDIGTHFPPSDPQWQNANSAIFIAEAMRLLSAKNGILINADIMLLAEEPKLSPHRPAIKMRIAELLKISPDRVAVKATTTEKLGYIGRCEGLAAQAVVTIKLPAL